MKRFIIDFLLIFILVMIGSSIPYEKVEDKIEEYDQSLQIPVNKTNSNNKVTHIVKKSGDIIENMLEVSVEVISSIFKAIIE